MELISVIIPLYNKGGFIENTFITLVNSFYSSSLCLSYTLQVVVIDDGSTDHSFTEAKKILDNLSHDFDFQFLIRTQTNVGVSIARNEGMKYSQGEYVCFLDADDLMSKEYFNFLSEAFKKHPLENFYATNYRKVNSSEISSLSAASNIKSCDIICLNDYFSLWAKKKLPFCASSVCFKKKFLVNNSLFFPEGENSGEDLFLWIKVGFITGVIYTEKEVVYYIADDTGSLSSFPMADIGPHVRYINEQVADRPSIVLLKRKIVGDCICELLMHRKINLAKELFYFGLFRSPYIMAKILISFFLGKNVFLLKSATQYLRS